MSKVFDLHYNLTTTGKIRVEADTAGEAAQRLMQINKSHRTYGALLRSHKTALVSLGIQDIDEIINLDGIDPNTITRKVRR